MFRFPSLLVLSLSFVASPIWAEAREQCEHCAKQLLPSVVKLEPGRKYARDRRVDIEHVKLDVTPDFAKRTVSGTMTMRFRPIALPLSKLELDAVDLRISSVTVIGAQFWDHQVGTDTLTLNFRGPVPPGELVTAIVEFSAQPERGLYFRTPEMGYKKGDTQVWSQGEPSLHRFWFPCYDYPNERFTSEVICKVPAGMEVISNGILVGNRLAGDHRIWHWRQDQPHVNYLIALAAGYFHKIEDNNRELPLALLVPPSQKEQASAAFMDTWKIIDFYNREIGVPFPWDKYYRVFCLDFIAGGMENTSCTFESAGMLFDRSTEQLRTLHRLDAHETAHQWFGNLLTCRDWSHLWLNEGFASYYTVLYEGEKNGRDAMKYSLWIEAEDVFAGKDNRPTVWRDYQDPMQQFGTRVYPKGAWILHMLRSQLGPDLYRKAIKTYVERHRNGIVGTDDLHDVVQEVSGLSFDQFFDQWLYHGGVPELNVEYAWDEGTRQAKVTIKQTQKLSDQVRLFRVPLPISFVINGYARVLTFTADVKQGEEVFYFALPSQPDLVRIDPDYTVLAKVNFKPPGPMLDKQLASDVIGRLLAARVLGEKKDSASAEKLGRLLRHDAFFGVREEAARMLAKMGTAEARSALIAGLPEQSDARARLAVVQAMASIPHKEVQQALQRHLGVERNPLVQAAIVKSWGARPADAEIAAKLDEELQSTSYQNVRALAAIAAHRAHDNAEAAPAILARLRATPLDFRTRDYATAMDALAFVARQRGERPANDEVRQFLVERLTGPKEELRVAAAKALGTLRDPRALAVLEPMLIGGGPFEDPVRTIATNSVQALQSEVSRPVELKNLWDQVQQLQKKTEAMQKELEDTKKKAEPMQKK